MLLLVVMIQTAPVKFWLLLSTYKVSLLTLGTNTKGIVGLLSCRVMQSRVQRVSETVYLAVLNATKLNYVLLHASPPTFFFFCQLNCLVLVEERECPSILLA